MKKILIVLTVVLLIHKLSIAQCGSTNVALSKNASSSSNYNQYTVPSLAVDGDVNTAWKSGTNNSSDWIKIDLGQSMTVCKIKLLWPADFYFAVAYNIEISSDNSNWTSVLSEGSGNGNTDEHINLNHTGQYLRLTCTQKGAGWADHFELFEFEIYTGTGNNAPSVSITSPTNNQSFTQGTNIVINANASDNDGTITKVEFYQGTTLLGEDNSSPYSYTWTNAAVGSYSITAKAIDDDNASTTSSAVNISVNAASGGSTSSWLLTGNDNIDPSTQFLGTKDLQPLILKTNNATRLTITTDGKVGIKTSTPQAELAVNGEIWTKKLKVTQTGWPDYVFDENYKLMPLERVAQYIVRYKHLPNVPSAKEVEKNGLNVGDNQAVLLRKIEELTLYLIEQDKKIKEQERRIAELEKQSKPGKK